jgi:hypothetical protein
MTNAVVTSTSHRSNPMHLRVAVVGLVTTVLVAGALLQSATRPVGHTSAAPPASEPSSTKPVDIAASNFSVAQGRPQ